MNNKIVIWGIGNDFEQLWPFFEHEIKENHVCLIACIDKNPSANSYHFGVPCISKTELKNYCFNWIVISSSMYFYDILDEILALGIDEDRVIDGRIFSLSDFDFNLFAQEKRLSERIFDNSFTDTTYADRDRVCKKKNLSIFLGRKSYIGASYLEGDFDDWPINIVIGRYTSISWEIYWELSLNMDHDYHRVCNYGVTHFSFDYTSVFGEIHFGGSEIHIGSDVWIGRGVHIKSGVSIGDGAVVAADSVVVSDVPPYAIVGGNPAKIIKYRFPQKIIDGLEKIKWWDWDEELIEKYAKYFSDPQKFVEMFL